MKKILSLCALAIMLCVAACQNGGYKVTGTVVGAEEGDTVVLANIKGMFNVDTLQTAVIKNGKFSFTGQQDTAAMRYVIWKSTTNPDLTVAAQFALENANITLRIDSAENTITEISGTPANEALTELSRSDQMLEKQAETIFAVLNDTTATAEAKTEAENKLNDLQEQMITIYTDFIKANVNNIAGTTYLSHYASMMKDNDVIEILANIPEALETEGIKKLREVYDVKAETAIGKPFKDIKANTPEGGELAVSDVAKNAKVLMIDFWASWCGPCRQEMPNVKAAYEKFHAQGFDIIGVSLDSDAEAWKKAIADLGITWPQISDLKGWECAGAALYGVRSIPATVLIKDGVIVDRDVRGSKIAEKVEELLK